MVEWSVRLSSKLDGDIKGTQKVTDAVVALTGVTHLFLTTMV